MSSLIGLKKKLTQAAAICEMEGLCGPFGHVSARIPGTDRIVMTPSGPPGRAKLRDVVTLNLRGEKVAGGGKPNRELPIHTSIYRVRDDVQSVVHVHPPKVIAFSVADREVYPMSFEDRRFYPSVKIFGEPDEEVYIDSDELGERMAQALGKDMVLIIRGHGVVAVGDSIEAACIHAVALEKTAEIQFMAAMLLLTPSVKHHFKTAKLFDPQGPDVTSRLQKRQWDFYVSKLDPYENKRK